MQLLFHIDFFLEQIRAPKTIGSELLELCRSSRAQGWIPAAFLPVLYREAREKRKDAEARALLGDWLKGLSLLPQTGLELRQAWIGPGPDPEETLTLALASQCGLDGVVSWTPERLSGEKVSVGSPEEWVRRLKAKPRPVDRVPLLDIPATYSEILNDVEQEMVDVLRSGQFILGPKLEALENKMASYCQTPYAVGVSSGTDALLVSLMAAGIGEGDEVITTPYTFFATAGCISRVGARPVFVDIEPETYNLDPDRIDEQITSRTRAILPVHLYGQCADMDAIQEVAHHHNLVIIEDAAQAVGSEYKFRRAGSLGDFGCFSFFPTKNLGGFGDGGMVTVFAEEYAERLKVLRVHGAQPKYYHNVIGGNFRLDALQAAVVSAKLKYLEGWTERRRTHALRYHELIRQSGLSEHLGVPEEIFPRHVYNQYVIRAGNRRDELKKFLAGKGVATEIYYPVPLHLQECFRDLGGGPGDFPVAEQAARETLALPVSHEVTPEQQEYVVQSLQEFFKK